MGEFDPWTGKGRPDAGGQGLQAIEAVRRFVKSRQRHCSEATVDTYRYVLEAFASSLPPGFPLYGVEAEHVSSYVQGHGLADATAASYNDRLRIFFSWCEEEGLRKGNPVPPKGRGKKSRRVEGGVPEFFSEKQFRRFLRAAEADAEMKSLGHGNRWLLDAARFAAGTGLRRGEVVHLRWQAVDLRGRMLRVECTEEFTTKSGRERSVPLVGDARRVVQARWKAAKERSGTEPTGYVFRGATGGKIGPGYLTERFRFYRRLAKVCRRLWKDRFSGSFASWFVMRGGDLYRLKEILGHADMKTTLKYAHLRPEALRQEMQKTFGGEHTGFDTASLAEHASTGGDGTASNASALRAEVKRLQSELAEARTV